MAGGEFCVNATRSSIYYYLNGNYGTIKIKTPNLHSEIEGGIDEKGETWLFLETYKNSKECYSSIVNKKVLIVKFKGIIHVVINGYNLENKNDNEIKNITLKILNEFNLLEYKASGVIFIKNKKNNILITPVVYVKNIKTFFIETACGSGSAAVAVYEFLKFKKRKCNIMQPSNMLLTTEIYSNKKRKIKKIKISGIVYEIKKNDTL